MRSYIDGDDGYGCNNNGSCSNCIFITNRITISFGNNDGNNDTESNGDDENSESTDEEYHNT